MPTGGVGELLHQIGIPGATADGDWIDDEVEMRGKEKVEPQKKGSWWMFWR